MSNPLEPSHVEFAARQKTTREIIERTNPEDYDGHTEFSRMTPTERLTWLDQAVLFIESRKQPQATWQVAEKPSTPYKAG